jgi:hypothetical protein
MAQKLREGLDQLGIESKVARFRHVLLVEDFTGSGFTLMRPHRDGWKGKLARARDRIGNMKELGTLDEEATVSILLYVAAETAERRLREQLKAAGLDWRVDVMQSIPDAVRVDDPELLAICEEFFDEALIDRHKGDRRVPLGFGDAALPLVLHHNTPNNSVCILWGDTSEQSGSLDRHALFPRYERHHRDRP